MIHVCSKRDGRWQQLPNECIIATQYPKPEGLAHSRWAQNISYMWYVDGNDMARNIANGLKMPNGPEYVMIDELKAASAKKIYDCAKILRTQYPELNGRWGIYLVNGRNVNYAKRGWFSKAIAESMRGDAIICPEFYLKASDFNSDWKIKREMMGRVGRQRARWLIRLRKRLRSRSRIVALMGITPHYLNEQPTVHFATRQARIWKDTTGATMGAWKWDVGTQASPNWPIWRKR